MLGEAGVERFFSQQSNEELADLAADIDPSMTVNGGLSVDDRKDLFNLLSKALSPENQQRWRTQLSEGLGQEFDSSVSNFPSIQARSFSAQHSLSPIDALTLASSRPAILQPLNDSTSVLQRSGATPIVNQSASVALIKLLEQPATVSVAGLTITSVPSTNNSATLVDMGTLYKVLLLGDTAYQVYDGVIIDTLTSGETHQLGQRTEGFMSARPATVQYDEQAREYTLDSGVDNSLVGRQSITLSIDTQEVKITTPNMYGPGSTSSYVSILTGERFASATIPAGIRVEASDTRIFRETLADRYERYMTLVKGLPGDQRNPFDRNTLASAMVNVDADVERVKAGTKSWTELAGTIVSANSLFNQKGYGNLISAGSNGSITVTYHTRYPSAMGITRDSRTFGNHEYGQIGWQGRRSLGQTYAGEVFRHASRLEQALWERSSARDLSFVQANESATFATYAQYRMASAIASSTPMDFSAVPAPGVQSNTAFLLEQQQHIAALDLAATGSESGKRRYARANYLLAGNILGAGSNSHGYAIYPDQATRESALFADLRGLANVLSATDMGQLGFSTTRTITDDDGGDSRQVKLGKFGNFGEQKYYFAQAFLNSSLEQRQEYLGIDAQAWSMASPFVNAGIQGEIEARAIERAEFGFDDFVKLTIAGGAIAAGFIFPPAAQGASFLATAAATGASAGLTTFGTVFAITGDLESSLKAAASSFLSGGVTRFAGQFTGKSRLIADAFSRGIINELNGSEFVDGVMSSVLQHYGSALGHDLSARLQDMAPEFVADLSGKMLESAILNEGDLSNFDDILKNYVLSYASGAVNTSLAPVFGSESAVQYTQIFDGVSSALLVGGERGLTDYLSSSAFLNSLGEGVSIDVVEYFGGADSFKGEVLSQLARATIISGGDPDRLASSAITIGQGMFAQYSADILRTGLSHVPAEHATRAETLTELLEVGITTGWDASTMRGYAAGPLLESLTGTGQTINGLPVGEQTLSRFLMEGVHMLADSYGRHEGDMDRVATDVTLYLSGELTQFVGTQSDGPVVDMEGAELEGDSVTSEGGLVGVGGGPVSDSPSIDEALALIRSVLDGSWAEQTFGPDGQDSGEPIVLAANGPLGALNLPLRRTDSELNKIIETLQTQSPVDQRRIIEIMQSEGNIERLVDLLEGYDSNVLEPSLKALSENLQGKQLNIFYQSMSDELRVAYVETVEKYGSDSAKINLVDRTQIEVLKSRLDTDSVHGSDYKLLLDAGQISLDILGIFDPTPISDGTNAVISMLRGNWFDAGISLVSAVPYIGDLAKAGRLGKVAQLGEDLLSRFAGMAGEEIAATAMGRAIIPVLNTISGAIAEAQNAIGGTAWNQLGPETQDRLQELKRKIDGLLGGTPGTVTPLPAPRAQNSQNLTQAGWSQSRIATEFAIRNAQFKAVHEVDSWVKAHNSTVDEYFRIEFPKAHPGVNVKHAKGNYGEMRADLELTERYGYIPLSTGKARVQSFNQAPQRGIDGLYQKADGSYVVVEVKSNDNVPTKPPEGDRQMSDRWLFNRLRNLPLDSSIVFSNIKRTSNRVLINYQSIGSGALTFSVLDEDGLKTGSRFNP